MRTLLILALTMAVIGCATPFFPAKTQRELDIDQCTYGANVTHEVPQRDRAAYINSSVADCLKAKGYTDSEATP